MTAQTLPERLRALLEQGFAPTALDIRDDSDRHAGHAGASAGGHYAVQIRSAQFTGMPPLARHRAVYAALANLMGNGIHALSLQTLAPDEPAP